MIKILYHFRKKSMAIYAEAKAPLHKMPLKFSVTEKENLSIILFTHWLWKISINLVYWFLEIITDTVFQESLQS